MAAPIGQGVQNPPSAVVIENGGTTLSVVTIGGGLAGISAGTNQATNGTVQFANSNGVTFGMNTAGVVTASAVGGGGGGAVISGGTNSQSTGTVVFGNGNGVTFGLQTNGSMTASVQTNYQAPGAYLTTAALSDHGHTQYLTTAQPPGAYLTTAAQSVHTHDYQSTGAYLTTAALSNHVHSLNQIANASGDVLFTFGQGRQIQFQFSNTGTFTTNANKQGLFEIDVQGNLVDGADAFHVHQSDNDPTIDLAHFEAWGTNVTAIRVSASASVGMEINKPIKWVGAAPNTASVPLILQSGMSNSIQYLNANFLQGSQASQFQSSGAYLTTAQPVGDYLTTAAQSGHTHGSGPSITGGISVTSNSNAWSLAVGAYLTTAMASNAGSGFMSTSERANYFATAGNTFANSTHSHGNPTLYLTNLTGTTASASNGFSLSISAAAPGAGGGVGTQFSGTNVSGTLDSNGISLSVAAPGGGGGITDSQWPNAPAPLYSSSLYTGASGNTGGSTQWTVSGYLGPLVLERPLHFSDFEYYVSATNSAGTGSMSFGHQFGIYSLNGGTAHSLISSFCWQAMASQNSVTAQTWHQFRDTASSTFSTAANGNISASYTGIRQIVCHTTSQSLAAGTYALAHIFTARSSGLNAIPAGSAFYSMAAAGSGSTWSTGGARFGTNTFAPPMYEKRIGIFSTTTNQSTLMLPIMPASIHTSALSAVSSSQWRFPVPLMYL